MKGSDDLRPAAIPDDRRTERAVTQRDFTLVLGGGGMKGLAHIGVLAALEECDFLPTDIVGSSIGAFIAAAWCSGMSATELEDIAVAITRRDLFRVAHRQMAFKRMRSPGLYRREPLENLIRGLLGDLTFAELDRPLLVNTMDLNSGVQVLWGAPGLADVPVAAAVYASCALPGFLPPCEIRGRHYVDGAAVSNLPVGVASARGRDLIVAVDVGSSGVLRADLHEAGFAAVYARAIEIAIERMRTTTLRHWQRPPLLFIQPRVEQFSMFSFNHNEELIAEGYRATAALIKDPDGVPSPSARGVYPRRDYSVRVEREHCIGCGACLIHGPPGLFTLDASGKAVVTEPNQTWSPVDVDFVRQCPTYAIVVREGK